MKRQSSVFRVWSGVARSATTPIAAQVVAVLWMLGAGPACAGGATPADQTAPADAAADPHAHHHHHTMLTPPAAIRSTANYAIPDTITLTRADGTRVNIAQELDEGRPVLLDFIYTTCTTICPVMSQTFAEVQKRLGADAAKIRMVSISIDPEQDTPARLTEYAKHLEAGPQWQFYTGTLEASVALQRVFNVYRGDKMSHAPVTFFRGSPGQPWVRLDGFATPDALVSELRPMVAQK
jgi:protein SCO1/2